MNKYIPNENMPKNTYKHEKKPKKSNKLSLGVKMLGITALLVGTLFGANYLQQRNLNPSRVNVVDGPDGYEFHNHKIPTSGNVSEITLGRDTLEMKITRCPETNTITYEGPINYRISNPRAPTSEPDIVDRFSRDTRYGEVTLRKSQ